MLSALLLAITCGPAQRLIAQEGYRWDEPELISALPDILEEISGLGMSPDGSDELLAVQDEKGKVFRLNTRNGEMIWSTDFWKDGDYEGVEGVSGEIWVVKSTGTLYQIKKPGEPNQRVEKFNTHLTGDNDVEGLAYDPSQNRLLLACKVDADDDGRPKNARYIFAFDLNSKRLSEEPVYTIEHQAVNEYLGSCPKSSGHEKLCEFFSDEDDYDLAPSSLAVHPITGQLYLTSSKGRILMVIEPDGRIVYLHKLDKDLLPQPEGLAFTEDGTLFLSTEAKNGQPPRLYRLAYAK